MRERDLKDKLQLPYKPIVWKELLPLFFKKVVFFSHPEKVFSENRKVISGMQVGAIELDDSKSLAVFEVEVDDTVNIVRNRQGLREIAAKHIDQNITHGAIVFFFNQRQKDYRFSFIAKWSSIDLETGELIKGETKPKRFTYLLGPNEACTTPAKRLMVLAENKGKGSVDIQMLKDAFSVETLNKEFFKTYKAHYERFWKHLASEDSPFRSTIIDESKKSRDKQEKPIRDYVKKLLGRIVFLHFLQKKGWMGCSSDSTMWVNGEPRFMQLLFEDFTDKEHFNTKCLNKLFFETLNRKRQNDIFKVEGLVGKLNGSRVPYLNGGLFEPEKNKFTLEVDFPSFFFEELLEFFEQYNFTIDENRPEDHEVGIDPEMLGHIFENLLEENREKGAFYTPKEIVQYMCKESLIHYLCNYFDDRKAIADFIRLHTIPEYFSLKENAISLDRKLNDVKVCDPAIGSGAFPIGMLQEVFEAKKVIHDIINPNVKFDSAYVKKSIIQNSIYGVDLEKGAVDIAQLRFWLALVVEEESPHPLPNLDYKIMQGNSLLEQYNSIDLSQMGKSISNSNSYEPQRDLFGNITESQMKITYTQAQTTEEIQKLIKYYYSIEKAEEKQEVKAKINNRILKHIEYNLELKEEQLRRNIEDVQNPELLNRAAKKKYDNWAVELGQLNKVKEQLVLLQETNERPYFLWHLYFMDVYEKGGFDIIIGNPPYIQLQKMGQDADALQQAKFETFERTGDIYSLFYEKGINLLNNNGVLCYITSNKWMRTNYGASTRHFFAEKTYPLLLIDFGNIQVFETATVDTNILLLKKKPKANKYETHELFAVRLGKDYDLKKQSLAGYVAANGYHLSHLTHNSWVIGERDIYDIKGHVEKLGKPLFKWDITINYGIKTGFNNAFIIPGSKRDQLIKQDSNSAELLNPVLRGKDISSWYPEFDNYWIISTFPSRKINIDSYPAIRNYLLDIGRERLEQDGKGRKKTGNKWFETQDQISYWRDFERPKIIYPNMTKYLPFVYDEEDHYYSNDKSFILVGDQLKYLTCFFNSKLFKYCFLDNFPELQGGTRELRKVFFDKIPVKPITVDEEGPFNKIVEYLVALKKEKSAEPSDRFMFIYFEQVADALIYEFYFEEEFSKSNLSIAKHFDYIPLLHEEEPYLHQLRKIYITISAQEHPIRQAIFSMLSIPQIALINNTAL